MNLSTRLMPVALALATTLGWHAASCGQDVAAADAEFAQQWREVRAKYPLVAWSYLQTYEALSEARAQPSAAQRAAEAAALRLGVSKLVPVFRACAACRPATDTGDIERHSSCIEKRLNCLRP